MFENLRSSLQSLYETKIIDYFTELSEHPLRLISSIIDIVIVVFLIYTVVKVLRETRAWQLLKGIAVFIICTLVSGWLNLTILNYILTSVMMYGGILLIIVFQPELRRGLEQLRNKQIYKAFWNDKRC